MRRPITAATSDNGMATSVIADARTFARNTTVTSTTSSRAVPERRVQVGQRHLDEVGLTHDVSFDPHAFGQCGLDLVEGSIERARQL